MNLVYHGTRYLREILLDDCLKMAPSGDRHVSLTWSWDEAKYWADLPRDTGDHERGWIIGLDRDSLERAGYSLVPFQSTGSDRDERNLAVMRDINPLSAHVVSVELIDNRRVG